LLRHIQHYPPQLYPTALTALPDLTTCLKPVLRDFWQAQAQSDPDPLLWAKWVAYYSQSAQLGAGLILACWTFDYDGFKDTDVHVLDTVFSTSLPSLLETVEAQMFLIQTKRQEEWGRWFCQQLGKAIQNESTDQSERRWQRLSSIRRAEVFQEIRQQRRRQLAIQRAQMRLQAELD